MFGVLATAVTSAPEDLASWTAKLPTPPEPPLISTCRPGWMGPWRPRPWRAVTAAIGTAAVAMVQKVGIDLVAGREPGDAATDRFDLPGNVDAEDLVFRPQQPQGGPREEGLAAQDMPVGRIDRDRPHLDQDLTGTRGRLVDLDHPKRLRRPIPLVNERLHGRYSGSRPPQRRPSR